MPEVTSLIFILNLGVWDRCTAMRAPVYYSFASVDKSLIIVVYENFLYSLWTALVHCETLSVPIAGRAELFKLLNYSAAVFLFPIPCSFKETVPADIVLCKALFTHSFNYLCFCCDRSVVCTRYPLCGISAHSLPADKYILQSFIKGMTHMELSCDVRWWDNYTVWLFLGIRLGMEKSAVKPVFVDLIFYLIRLIKLWKLFFHYKTIPFANIFSITVSWQDQEALPFCRQTRVLGCLRNGTVNFIWKLNLRSHIIFFPFRMIWHYCTYYNIISLLHRIVKGWWRYGTKKAEQLETALLRVLKKT